MSTFSIGQGEYLGELYQKIRDLEKKLETIKPILKQIEQSTNSRPPRVLLEELHLNEQWFRVWDILGDSQFKEISESE